MNKTNKVDQKQKEIDRTFVKLRKDGLIVDVIGQDGVITMLTAKGYEQHKLLSLFTQANPNMTIINPIEKPKKSRQDKMDSAMKTMAQVGAGISQLMQGIGKIGGDPVKMDMSQAGIGMGQYNKPKRKRKRQRTRK